MRIVRRMDVAGLALSCAVLAGCSAGTDGPHAARHGGRIRLSPDPAFACAQITVVTDGSWDLSRSTIRWSRNGQVIADAAAPELRPPAFSKGDKIGVEVLAVDAGTGVQRSLNASVQVVDSPPRLSRVTLTIAPGTSGPVVQANVDCSDPDGDTPQFTYRWLRNGVAMDGASGAAVPVSSLKRGEKIAVEVEASDGSMSSAPMRSEPLAIADLPPQFTSTPGSLSAGSSSFDYQAVAVDPDGDPVKFELVSGPTGMTVDPQGHVTWMLPTGEDRKGSYPVRLRASDGIGGETTQEFTIQLDAATRVASAH